MSDSILGSPEKGEEQGAFPFVDDHFFCYVEKICANLHVLNVHDLGHRLGCAITLDTVEMITFPDEGGSYFVPAAACRFSGINLRELAEETGLDSECQRAILYLFQLRVLEQLFFFCGEREAEKLVIMADDANLDFLEVYRPFFASQKLPVTENGEERTQIIISMNEPTYNDVMDVMKKTERDFRAILWRDYHKNPAIREYLKHHACV